MQASRATPDIDGELVEYLVVVVPDEVAAAVVLESALDLARRGVLTLLDGALVTRSRDAVVQIGDLPQIADNEPAPLWPSLLSEHDVELVASEIPPDLIGVILVIEDRWAAPLAATARRLGGYVAGGDRIPSDRLPLELQTLGVEDAG